MGKCYSKKSKQTSALPEDIRATTLLPRAPDQPDQHLLQRRSDRNVCLIQLDKDIDESIDVYQNASALLPRAPDQPDQHSRQHRIIQNVCLIWLDKDIDESKDDYQNALTLLRTVVNAINTFTDTEECIDFINEVQDEKVIIIVSGYLAEDMVPMIHDMSAVLAMYIFYIDEARYKQMENSWRKVRGVYTQMTDLVEDLREVNCTVESTAMSISFVTKNDFPLSLSFLALDEDVTNKDLNQLDASFMITQTLKEILLEIELDQQHFMKFINYCREQFRDDSVEINNVIKLEREYHHHTPIWWYTYNSFLYLLLNRSLRLMDVDIIIKIGFFLRDLHVQIAELHHQQSQEHHSTSFTVYRGQGMSHTDFERLYQTKGGLLSFNTFLSTSKTRDISLQFAQRTVSTSDLVGILFVIVIDPSILSTPFADVSNVSYYQAEEELLFSMHSTFRIRDIKNLDHNERLYQVELTLTSDQDTQLELLTTRLRRETRGSSGWDRMGKLLIKIGLFHTANEIYQILLDETSNNAEKVHYYHQLGYIKEDLGAYNDALNFYERSVEMKLKSPSANSSHLAMYYNNVGSVYDKKGQYSTAVSFYKKAIDIYETMSSEHQESLATCYNNLGAAYRNMDHHSAAILFYEKALAIDQATLPLDHPLLAITYNNIGLVYDDMQNYEKAIESYKKALSIYLRALGYNHPELGTVYSNIGSAYNNIGDYSKALSCYEHALEIDERTLPPDHSSLGVSYNNIGTVYKNTEEYSKALSMFERALDIESTSQSLNHNLLQLYTKNIEFIKEKMK